MEVIFLFILCLALLAFCIYREREFAKERQLLLTRIQAPELAPILAPDRGKPKIIKPLPYDDDLAFHQQRERLNEAAE